jgi:hypothetical protein
MILELGMGMFIMCKKKNYGPKEIVNDTLGHVIGYWLLETIIIHHRVIDGISGYTYLFHPRYLK